MKLINLENVLDALEKMEYKIHISEKTRNKAKLALDRMLYVS